AVLGPFYSPWFVLLEFLLLVTVLPRMMGFWLVSQEKPGRYNPTTLTLNLVLVAALFFLGVRDGIALEPLILGFSLLLSFVAVELAWRRGRRREEAVGIGDVSTQRLRVRNELTYDLGLGLVMTGFALAFALIDTLGHALQQSLIEHNKTYTAAFATILGMLMALAPVAQMLAKSLTRPPKAGPPSAIGQLIKSQVTAGLFALVLLAVPLVTYSFTVHAVYQGGEAIEAGWLATGLALLLSFILTSRQAVVFVNRSSLSHTYSSRLARTFLGATNPQRHHPSGQDVTEVMAGDDVSALTDYRPHETGGPLHLLNLTVNQTIDFSSRRGNRYRKGDPMAVSCLGLSLGTRYHALWQARCSRNTSSLVPATAGVAPVGVPPEGDHPLLDEAGHAARAVEMLPLREWMAISGAAVGPSRGYNTELGTALLCGLANLRTGYWWNSGLSDAARDGFPSHTFARRLLYLAPRLFRTQALLIAEWIGRFPGPWERYWNLSDGGFSEVTGAYELIRRRTPRIIVGDATEDPNYEFEGLANLIRLVRIDFGANIEFIPEELLGHPPADDAGRVAAAKAVVPPVMQRGAASAQSMAQVTAQQTYLRVPDSVKRYLGTLDDLKSTYDADGKVKAHSRKHAALFWVVYPDHTRSLLLYLKSSVTGDESRDVIQYQDTHTEFPQESTEDQFFNEPQWESYRRLGEHAATPLFASGDWFWKVPV
ncbi:MAG: hypothetical protein JO117_04855, partial [Verrucomicrobia bacterium]|nr:hypothetical protein [Verrucomicrobiota bacterium]